MKRVLILMPIACAVILCGCAGEDSSSGTVTATVTTTTSATASSAPESKPSPVTKRITAEARSYKDGSLTFEYEGKEYTLPLAPEDFVNSFDHLKDIDINEKIINNPFGIAVKADMQVTEDMSQIMKCDVETVNGARYVQTNFNEVYRMRPETGSVYRIESEKHCWYIELNSLDNIFKAVISEDEEVGIDGVVLGDKLLCRWLLKVTERRGGGTENPQMSCVPISNNQRYHYLGTVQEVREESVKVKLNLTDKELTLPPYLTDGALTEGTQVAVTLMNTPEELAASEDQERDFAVFWTDMSSLLPEKADFSELAYFRTQPGSYEPPYTFTRLDGSAVR